MAGLLDFLNSAEAQAGLGLLAAAGPRSDGAGFGQRLQEGLGAAEQWKARQAAAKRAEMQDQMAQMQMAQQQQRLAIEQEAMKRQASDEAAVRSAVASGQFDPRTFLQGNPQAGLGAMKQVMEYNSMLNPAPKERTLSPGQVVYQGDKKILEVPKEAELPSSVREFQYGSQNPAYNDWLMKGKAATAPKMSVDLRDPTAVAKAAMSFQNDYRTATKPSYARAQAYESMMQAAADPSAKGDLTMVYSFIKALDPESVVREGEISLVNANRSIPDQVKGYAQKLATGKNLLPQERQDLIRQAQTLTATDYKRSRNDVKAYRDNAARLGLDPDLYAPDPYAGFKPPAENKPAGKTVVKTGMYGGRKVVQYSDGTTDYAN